MTAPIGLREGLAALAICVAAPPAAAQPAPFVGCYERVYDAAHLAAHRGQIVRRVKLKIGPTSIPKAEGGDRPPVVDAILEMRVSGARNGFTSIGACWADGDALVCNASLSAEERPLCKTKEDGVRDCRVSNDDAGSFRISQKGADLLVAVRERLELSGPEGGPYLYLSPGNAENRAFLLKKAPADTCR